MQETVSLAQNKSGQTAVYRFIARLLIGLIGAILIGMLLDKLFNTSPIFLLGLLLYVILGSLFLLVKELG